MTTFRAETRLPLASVVQLARAQSDPLVQLDPAQVSLLQAFSSLHPFQRYDLVRAALESNRAYISAACVLALMPQSARATEQPAVFGEQ